jgi:hypothetical protein
MSTERPREGRNVCLIQLKQELHPFLRFTSPRGSTTVGFKSPSRLALLQVQGAWDGQQRHVPQAQHHLAQQQQTATMQTIAKSAQRSAVAKTAGALGSGPLATCNSNSGVRC